MNTVLSQLYQMRELCKQALPPGSQILPTSALYKMDIKIEKAIQDAEKVHATACRTCEGIGTPNSINLTVELGAAIDE